MTVLKYDDFSGGEFGELAADKAPPTTFSARNMVVYETGLLGPRAGVKEFPFTGVEADPVRGMLWRGTSPDLAVSINDAIFRYDTLTPGAQSVFTGFLTGTPSGDYPVQGFEYGNAFVYSTVAGDASYVLDFVGGTVTELTGSPGGVDCCLYGERMIVAGDGGSNVGRLYYSAALDFNDWPAGNFIDVGNASGAITGVWAQRGHLTIQTQNGEWWVLTGVPGTGTLRRVSGGGVHPWTAFTDGAELLGNDLILNVPISADFPATFNGATVTEYRHLRINDTSPQLGFNTVKVVHGFRPDEAVVIFPGVAGDNRVGLFRNGVWTFHTFEVELSVHAVSDRQGRIFLTDGGSAGVAPVFYQWYLPMSRPAFVGDDFSDTGDATDATPVSAEVSFPEHWAADGTEVRCRQVIVEFDKFLTGSDNPNGFQVEVKSLGRFREDDVSTVTRYWSDDATFATEDGLRDRVVLNFGRDVRFGGGFQLRLHSVVGVAFRSIRVELVERPFNPRS